MTLNNFAASGRKNIRAKTGKQPSDMVRATMRERE
jgi:hypothetical protein